MSSQPACIAPAGAAPEIPLGAPALAQVVNLHVWGGPHRVRLLRVQQLQLARRACRARGAGAYIGGMRGAASMRGQQGPVSMEQSPMAHRCHAPRKATAVSHSMMCSLHGEGKGG